MDGLRALYERWLRGLRDGGWGRRLILAVVGLAFAALVALFAVLLVSVWISAIYEFLPLIVLALPFGLGYLIWLTIGHRRKRRI